MATRPELPIREIQADLAERGLDGGLLWDFRGQNPTAVAAVDLSGHMLTRRWAYLVPRQGEPVLLVHRIEAGSMPKKPGGVVTYAGYRELHDRLRSLLAGRRRVAMEYCALGAIPYLSRVDAGTVELVRSFGVEVVSSADLVQVFEAVWSDQQLETHLYAAKHMREIVDEIVKEVRRRVLGKVPVTEVEIQEFILKQY